MKQITDSIFCKSRANDTQPTGDICAASSDIDFSGHIVKMQPLTILSLYNALCPQHCTKFPTIQGLQSKFQLSRSVFAYSFPTNAGENLISMVVVMVVVMMTAVAFLAVVVVVMMTAVAFLAVVVVMMVTAAAFFAVVMVVMMVPTAAFFTVVMVVMMVTAAAFFAVVMVVMMVTTSRLRCHLLCPMFLAFDGFQNLLSVQLFPWCGNDGSFCILVAKKL